MAIIKHELKVRNEELQRVKIENRRLIDSNERLQGEFDNYKALSKGQLQTTRLSTADLDKSLSKRTVTFQIK